MSTSNGFYRKTKSGDNEFVTVTITDDDGEEFEITNLRSIFKETLEEQKDKLEKIVNFGTAFLGDYHKGVVFMFGWVVMKIIATYEAKNDTKLHINIDTEILDKEEVKDKTLVVLKDVIERIENDEIDLTDLPLYMSGMDDYE